MLVIDGAKKNNVEIFHNVESTVSHVLQIGKKLNHLRSPNNNSIFFTFTETFLDSGRTYCNVLSFRTI